MDCYSSCLIVDLDAIGRNIDKIRSYTGVELLPVVKSNAYGFGTVEIGKYLVHSKKMNFLAVARLYEACELRHAGCWDTDILVLGPVMPKDFPFVVKYGVEIPIFRASDVHILSQEARRQCKTNVRIHIKVETGMNRIGARPGGELEAVLAAVKQAGNLVVDGVFTHFATADQANAGAGNDFTRLQFNRFKQGLAQIQASGFAPRYIHCCNTGATTWLKEAYSLCSHVRTGSLYLGYSSIQNDWNPVEMEESGSWQTEIVNLRTIQPGESVGYGRAFQPEYTAVVATIPVGYGDGYLRNFAVQGAPVLIGGQRCRFVSICMDMGFIDVTGVPCRIGDQVTLFGSDGNGNAITGLEIGHLMGETRLAMFSHITQRVARVYKQI